MFLCNIVASLWGYVPSPLDLYSLVGTFITISVIIAVLALLPTISAGDPVSRFAYPAIIMGLLFSVSFPFGVYEIPIGLGWGSNLMALFPADINDPNSIGFIFFTFLTAIALITGMMMATEGD